MKIYLYQKAYFFDGIGEAIGIFELEADEKDKTYKIARGQGVMCSTFVKKDSLDEINSIYGNDMFSLSNDKLDYYKNLLIEKENKDIEKYKRYISSCEKEIEEIKALKVVKKFKEKKEI